MLVNDYVREQIEIACILKTICKRDVQVVMLCEYRRGNKFWSTLLWFHGEGVGHNDKIMFESELKIQVGQGQSIFSVIPHYFKGLGTLIQIKVLMLISLGFLIQFFFFKLKVLWVTLNYIQFKNMVNSK